MERVAVLGAGAMGSALTTPLARNGRQVHLWATELDRDILRATQAGLPHLRTGAVVDPRVQLFAAEQLGEALGGATMAVLAITSDAAAAVYARALPYLDPGVPVLIVSKGFGRNSAGQVALIPMLLEALAPGRHPLAAITGPCKANEVAGGWPTLAVFAGPDPGLLEQCRAAFATDAYTVVTGDDLIGSEVAAATKNAYAICLGSCDGMHEADGNPRHNLKAALFALAVAEMRALAVALGGRSETVYSFAGVGDLEVTALSGRNRALGERLGRNQPAREAIAEMEALGQTVEGPAAARLGRELVGQLAAEGLVEREQFPLLDALVALLDGEGTPSSLLPPLLRLLSTPPPERAATGGEE